MWFIKSKQLHLSKCLQKKTINACAAHYTTFSDDEILITDHCNKIMLAYELWFKCVFLYVCGSGLD